nr:hypothetical protein [Treponema sp.]
MEFFKKLFLFFTAVFVSAVIASCSDSDFKSGGGSSVVVSLSSVGGRSVFEKSDAVKFVVSISPGAHEPIVVDLSDSVAQTVEFSSVEVGRYTVTVKAYDSDGTKCAQGTSAEFPVRSGETSEVSVKLRCCVKDVESWKELSDAVDEAEDGDTIVLKENLVADSTLEISKYLSIKSEPSISHSIGRSDGFSGAVAQISKNASLSIGENGGSSITVSGNEGAEEALFVVEGSLYVLGSAVLSGNKSQSDGGAIRVCDGGALVVSGGIISGNSALNGGGIYAESGSSVSILGGAIEANDASENGGGLFCGGSLSMSGTFTIMRNTAPDENTVSNIYISDSAESVMFNSIELGKRISISNVSSGAASVMLMSDITITEDFEIDGSVRPSFVTIDGQGKYHINGEGATLVFRSVTFQNCYNNGFGGALNLNDCEATITDCSFLNNSASCRGAAINIAGWSAGVQLETTITGCTFSGNKDNEGCYDINASGQYTHLVLGGGNSSDNANPVICQDEVANGHADGTWE